ncbi:MAG: ParA family protein [bacterium]|nr:ParA family protein [bacterium]
MIKKHRTIFAIANQKGGVGKTTTAVNLSASLGAAEKKVLLVDMDPQANATSGFGINTANLESSIYDVLTGEKPVDDVIMDTDLDFVKVIPSKIDLVGAEIELVKFHSREYVLRKALQKMKNDFDFILIDTPPSLGLLTINVLTAADGVIIPIQTEYYALEGIKQLLNTIDIVKQKLNPGLVISGILLTMFDPRLNLSKQISEEVQNFFTELVFKTVIARNVKLGEAPSHGKPVLLYDAVSRGAQNYMNLAKEMIADEV